MIVAMGYGPILFGALPVVVLEMSLISPRLGLNVFVVKGIIPFRDAMLVHAALLIAFPKLAHFLPKTMVRKRGRLGSLPVADRIVAGGSSRPYSAPNAAHPREWRSTNAPATSSKSLN